LVRYAGLYARSIKRHCTDLAHAALEALRTQFPLFALEPLRKVLPNHKWRERIKPSFGFGPLAFPRCGQTMQLVEIWEPRRGHVWMRRWLETHRVFKALRNAFTDLRQHPLDHYQQLGSGFANTS
jgi:hypothetical protein